MQSSPCVSFPLIFAEFIWALIGTNENHPHRKDNGVLQSDCLRLIDTYPLIIISDTYQSKMGGVYLKAKYMSKKKNCDHNFEYQKWVHYRKGTREVHSFHYKQVCKKCWLTNCVERTRELYLLLKDEKWHSRLDSLNKRKKRLTHKNT